ncbi:MAG: ABC transporter substrate-binding protein [Acidaminococcaceae bacterium]|nr:ABC transporter substrate-binding protein [Acidaminococcaceae bacterium]
MKKTLILLLALLTCFVLGCANESKPVEKENTANATYSVVDDRGKVFQFAEPPTRMMTTSLAFQDILLEMVPVESFIATSVSAADPNYSMTAELSKKIPNKYRPRITVEQVLKYKPDLFITTPQTSPEVSATLEDMGVRVFMLNAAETYPDIKKSIAKLSELVNQKEKGLALVQRMEAGEKALAEKLAAIPKDKQKLVIQLTYSGTYGMLQNIFGMLCDLAYVQNGMEIMPVRASMPVSKEKIVELNPDVLFLPSWDAKGSQNSDAYFQQIITDPAYKDLKCVKSKAVYKFPERYRYCTSHYILEGAEYMAKLVYPEYLQ